jgi:putative transposase
MDVRRGRGYVYRIEYHLIWCVKYRRKVLVDTISDTLKLILKDIAEQNELEIVALEVMPDHVHMLLSATPQHSIPNLVKALKGASARRLFMAHPELKKALWGGHAWNPSYFVCTVSEHTRAQIRQYIEEQHGPSTESV